MGRKKKQSRKFKPKNEFRYNLSYTSNGHPEYIFGETNAGKYKSLPITHKPSSHSKYYPLTKNPDPSDDRKAYLRHNVRTASPKYYSKEPLEGWTFSKVDKAIVRHRIKEYKKGMNRQPKNWYVNKRKWNKKISRLSLAAYQNVSPAESASKVP